MLDFAHPLGDAVKKARTSRGFTQVNVAEQIDIDSRTIINIENYNGNPKMEVLFPLVRTLQIDPWEIFYPELKGQSSALRQLLIMLKGCSEDEIEAMLPVCQVVLSILKSKRGVATE